MGTRLVLERFRNYEVKIEESEKGRQLQGIKPRTPALSCQCSATELQRLDNYHPSKSTASKHLNLSMGQKVNMERFVLYLCVHACITIKEEQLFFSGHPSCRKTCLVRLVQYLRNTWLYLWVLLCFGWVILKVHRSTAIRKRLQLA